MQAVQRGEVRAFEILFERYRPRLFGFLIRRCTDASTAEDLLQETWLRVVRARDRFDSRRRFSTWLFQIANNLCRDRARRREVELRGTQGMRDVERVESAGRQAPQPELSLDMQTRLASLPDRLREVLVLRYQRDLSEREIAQIAGIPQGTVKSRLHQAIKVLRQREMVSDAD
jgi:RNA polymerase sigma-70 factor (ECF subfamily)